ncbi:hypothetical protein, partial [Bradyrhizobium guangdongense]|uniref:hypothetical protein n=1 Tax=Bradyrhizobium guangdongense TaxID=1325090 RepID=UPI001AEC8EE4
MKQKARASADFLGVLTIPRKVVSLCCFSITLFAFQSAQETRVSPGMVGQRDTPATNQTWRPKRRPPDLLAVMQKGRSPRRRGLFRLQILPRGTRGVLYPCPSAGTDSAE